MRDHEAPVTVILVSYNSVGVIAQALDSVQDDCLVQQIIVVDNASQDDTCTRVEKLFPQVKCIKNDRNLGFGCANNRALDDVTTDYVLLLNPDAVMHPGALAELLAAAKRYPHAAMLAPVLENEDGEIHATYKRNVFAREQIRDHFVIPDGDLCAEFLSGAVLLLRMEHFKKIGFFDPEIFLFYEDDDLCLRICEAGHELVLVPSARATHLQGQSSPGSAKIDAFKQYHLTWSRLYLEKKYQGDVKAKIRCTQTFFLSLIKMFGYLLLFKPRKSRRYFARAWSAADFFIGKNCQRP